MTDEAELLAAPAFPIVGIGCSAGGLEALTTLLEATPDDIHMALVVVQHLHPTHRSLMPELLQSHTALPVSFAVDGAVIAPRQVYVIPPGHFLSLESGCFRLTEAAKGQAVRMSVDRFLCSLATEQRDRSIGVILSGTGSDGTRGLQAIKEAGGLTIAEDPAEAAQSGMPRSAIDAGVVDFVLPLQAVPDALRRYVNEPYFTENSSVVSAPSTTDAVLPAILERLESITTIDFYLYKPGTLLRRIERRMSLKHIDTPQRYLELLCNSDEEAAALTRDLLISVTSFFRDAAAWKVLEQEVLPGLLKALGPDEPVRVWVPGCATGDEAYSFAMLLIEQVEATGCGGKIQIFASDVDDAALEFARNGVYPESITTDVDAGRLARFFVKADDRYSVSPALRECVTFAHQDLMRDAPFSRLHLVSCRNLLIYLDPAIQRQLLNLFHFALRADGVLMLGSSETVGTDLENLFTPIDRKMRLFRQRDGFRQRGFRIPLTRVGLRMAGKPLQPLQSIHPPALAEITRQLLFKHYMPAAVLIDAQSQCQYFIGPVDRYLKVASGEANQDLRAMVREGLRSNLRATIEDALSSGGTAITYGAMMGREDGAVGRSVSIEARSVEDPSFPLLLVTFFDDARPVVASSPDGPPSEYAQVIALEAELDRTRKELRATVGEFERSAEDLRASHEETMSINEEFQSTNEELETSKEELQSLNEELTTLNNQLEVTIGEQRETAADLDSLLTSTHIATIILDRDLCIRRFTQPSVQLFALRSTDRGRPLSDIARKTDDTELIVSAERVLRTRIASICEIVDEQGIWYNRRILPWQSPDGSNEGVVITFADISELKQAEALALRERVLADSIVETVSAPLLIVDTELNIHSANSAFHSMFQLSPQASLGNALTDVMDEFWGAPGLEGELKRLVADGVPLEHFQINRKVPGIGRRILELHARPIYAESDEQQRLLLAFDDITDRQLALEALQDRLATIIETVPDAIITVDPAQIVRSFSPSAERLFGHPAEAVVGQPIGFLLSSLSLRAFKERLAQVLGLRADSVALPTLELDAVTKDAICVPVLMSLDRFRSAEEILCVAVFHDLTLEKRQREELHQAQKMEAMGQLAGGVAHDFNNVLMVILGNLERLRMKMEDPLLQSAVDDALEAARMGATITTQMLAFGRLQAITPERFTFAELMQESEGILLQGLSEDITVRIDQTDAPWHVLADKQLTTNALLNLCINARDSMPGGGELFIEANNETLEQDDVRMPGGTPAGDFVRVTVRDSGHGMTNEERLRALEPFYTTRRDGKGSGLGLSMVYGFVTQSGGFVHIDSAPGQGTAVSLFLPRAANRAGTERKLPRTADNVHGGAEIVLLVEDEPLVRRLTLERLRRFGYTVVEAASGPEALVLLRARQDIDLLFTDVIMPGGMTGRELVEHARTLDPSIRVVLTTGYADDVLELEKHEVLLRKPYAGEHLAQTLRDVLDR